ncbi:transcriptional regulator, LacI family [Amphibacillus marinus]|uniref:Transcriptional regulator, LacI family n=1 Tax=Amphibacillus marinus TaxID=872970 RepID=A0A1H8MVI0_9BACI|nr:LacI family DNA-binding transcriptional regulator [Amphibacillus marinus]SEO21258.1 transcriptional regulator, LacI family [Amphibacillus marinus]
MTTLNDVAKKANVSKMTVSRVINHPEQVTEELRALVHAAMKELNYKPNVMAKALANNRTQIIKLLILEEMDYVEPYYMQLLVGIANELDKHAYGLQLVTKRNTQIGDSDGYIVCGMREADYEWLNTLEKPIVLFGENTHGYNFVDSDNQKSIERAVDYAISLDYERIIFVGVDVNEPFAISREKGYLSAMERHNKYVSMFRLENRSKYSAAFVRENWETFVPNTAFICASDRLALGIIREVKEQGGSIPEDFGVIGHDGVFLDRIAYPYLTTLKQSVDKMGAATAQLVLQKINASGSDQGNILFDTELKLGGTTRLKKNQIHT